MKQRGFTLLEVLIAMALFSLLGLACYQLLERVLHSERRIDQHDRQLRQLQRALGIFERDLSQAIGQPLSDDPSRRQALIGRADGLRLVRGGWSNPLAQRRSEVLEVSYRWQDDAWIREYRSPPERDQDVPAGHSQRLLEGVALRRLGYVDAHGRTHPAWPAHGAPLSLPQAIDIEFDAPGYPGLRRVVLLPGGQERDDE
ncbi:TPA: type II secretion system protein GspJ [Pseudomonas aeruginosa]|uniref:Type II secretion system protein J n=2 Tax=Pseudomonas aeruginosa group TaxID=136841 RepID=A0ABD7K651_PSEAI|nr:MULTISPECIES: type II secretion system minor pseudopilin GspJ [Pseudomonas aeruginosa group]ABR83078.1 general secretion pathway protein J [Pseudomonas aeruginosa PA7]KSC34040.1 type II secretion system protein GspJ [Pseudomonas paraeruginosa]KSC89694.1 type II secretion system protein GspJ [Pseudomonas aeruginosa]KSD22271.1 type II secretion system protein GspJ [Pseudomonas aeruginosa]KSG62576.1 type II secretion system protein GspJ [Pseudomonas aeruginosa]